MLKKILLLCALIGVSALSIADTLQTIQQQKIIRIGTTGDYQPLTWYDVKHHRYEGLEINLIKHFAKSLGVQVQFIKTSWPTLSNDLKANKFDVAVGGISIIPSRAKEFIFSNLILADNKVALIRCADLNKYRGINDINQPQIKVIENKGGSNEQFVKQNLKQAQLMLIDNNPQIFNKIINKNADVMITDNIEALYQKKQHPELCIIHFNAKIAPLVPKAFMMRKDEIRLQQKTNQWLAQQKNIGQLPHF